MDNKHVKNKQTSEGGQSKLRQNPELLNPTRDQGGLVEERDVWSGLHRQPRESGKPRTYYKALSALTCLEHRGVVVRTKILEMEPLMTAIPWELLSQWLSELA